METHHKCPYYNDDCTKCMPVTTPTTTEEQTRTFLSHYIFHCDQLEDCEECAKAINSILQHITSREAAVRREERENLIKEVESMYPDPNILFPTAADYGMNHVISEIVIRLKATLKDSTEV